MEYTEIATKLTQDERKVLDHCMTMMYTSGFEQGYIMGRGDLWILASKDTPETDEIVEVTVILPDGVARTSTARFSGGKWRGSAAAHGDIIAWRPKGGPYDSNSSLFSS